MKKINKRGNDCMNSTQFFKEAKSLIPGGVNSPVRAFDAVGGQPLYLASGDGAYVTDVDDNRYLDFCGSWGPLILGHAHPEVLQAVSETMIKGLTFGACHPLEVKMAKLVCEQVPAMEMVRMVNSGTEATMSAIRLARGVTNRQLILKFDGCYHGHADYLLVASGSGLLTGGITTSAGVSKEMVNDVLVVAYNDIEAVRQIFAEKGEEIAAVIVEPVAGNMGLVPPAVGFLETLRKETSKAGALLIFDEVISGFRLSATTYGEMVGIVPDLTCLGKIVGGGMPLAAFGGKKEIMEQLAPLGAVYQAGTLSGNPVALAAGIKTIELLISLNPYPAMEDKAKRIAEAVNSLDLPVVCAQLGGLFTLFFTSSKQCPTQLNEVKKCNETLFAKYHQAMLLRGFYLSPSQYELGFISAVHSDEDVDRFIIALREVLSDILN
jgi:glutamate-1-semialdehyde 2,1-aminomutase